MSFLDQQQAARRKSRRLRVQFAALAVLGVVPLNLFVAVLLWYTKAYVLWYTMWPGYREPLFGAVSGDRTSLLVAIGVLTALSTALLTALVVFRSRQLTRASRAFGTPDDVDEDEEQPRVTAIHPSERQLNNIVEEMALAAGIPPPAVHVMRLNRTINALSAGHTTADATIFVTQGALESLTREELQGVVAHEFSHILNGDMALNMRVAAFVYAFTLVPRFGIALLEAPLKVESWRGRALLWLALAPPAVVLAIVGSAHLLGARMLQASLGREREKLADASAVEFTRNPLGVKGALLKIAALRNVYEQPRPWVDDVAHMFFASAVERRWFATHPPIGERLRALDPHFQDAEIDEHRERERARKSAEQLRADERRRAEKERARQSKSRELLASPVLAAALPSGAAPEPASPGSLDAASAPAWLLALLFDSDPAGRPTRLAIIREKLGDATAASVEGRMVATSPLPLTARVQKLNQVLAPLRDLAAADASVLLELVQRLVRLDERRQIYEYALGRTAIVFLKDVLAPADPHGNLSLADAQEALRVLFCVLAQEGHATEPAARQAYEAGMHRLLPRERPEFAALRPWARALDRALAVLEELQPVAKELLIEAMLATVRHDERLTAEEVELVRIIASALHCPIPRGAM